MNPDGPRASGGLPAGFGDPAPIVNRWDLQNRSASALTGVDIHLAHADSDFALLPRASGAYSVHTGGVLSRAGSINMPPPVPSLPPVEWYTPDILQPDSMASPELQPISIPNKLRSLSPGAPITADQPFTQSTSCVPLEINASDEPLDHSVMPTIPVNHSDNPPSSGTPGIEYRLDSLLPHPGADSHCSPTFPHPGNRCPRYQTAAPPTSVPTRSVRRPSHRLIIMSGISLVAFFVFLVLGILLLVAIAHLSVCVQSQKTYMYIQAAIWLSWAVVCFVNAVVAGFMSRSQSARDGDGGGPVIQVFGLYHVCVAVPQFAAAIFGSITLLWSCSEGGYGVLVATVIVSWVLLAIVGATVAWLALLTCRAPRSAD